MPWQGLLNIQGISSDAGARYLASQGGSSSAAAGNSSFVQRTNDMLQLDGQRYTYQGFNSYYMLQSASYPGGQSDVTAVMDLAQRLGLTVIRTWAFSDGTQEAFPLQVQLGQLNTTILQALDYVVNQAEQKGIKLILTLTNYFADYGGMQQYVEWTNTSNASTVDQFYTDSNLQSAYKDYVTAIILRRNSITNILYRDDPNIFAWDLVNEPANPGDASGDALYDWLDMMSTYVKSIDPNHLVYYGTPAYFGASSPPELLTLNGNYSGQYSPYGALPYDSACQGEDWARNIAIPTIDVASFHVYPVTGFNGDSLTNDRMTARLQVASKAGKPMVIDEFNSKAPTSARNAFLQQIFGLITYENSPVVGTNIWMLADDTYPNYDQFEIYGDQNGFAQPLPPGPALTSDTAVALARQAIFRGFVAADACIRSRYQANDFVNGWQETLEILSTNRTFT
ncbi:hypothetical protein WJX73_002812 [Symbiochloris irregularis]|uniref:mannan endo-1,4-beta-mannosidase n=1 Tax=Symbiochloris irregularis TaxID=706552 RepID=A0AAW1PI60_9CHLO